MPRPATEAEMTEITVQVKDGSGNLVDVPLVELVKGYLRQDDYTRKSTQVAEERHAAEAALAQVNQLRTRLQTEPTAVILDIAKQMYNTDGNARRAAQLLAKALVAEHGPGATRQKSQSEDTEPDPWAPDEDLTGGDMRDDPVVAALQAELAKLQATVAQMGATHSVEGTLARLRAEHPDFSEMQNEVLAFARDQGIADLDVAYLAVMGQKAATAQPPKPPTLAELLGMGDGDGDEAPSTAGVLTGRPEGAGPATSDPNSAIERAIQEVLGSGQ